VTAKVNDGLEDEDGPESSQEVIFGEEMQFCTPQEAQNIPIPPCLYQPFN
jgi:hypothetical protein